MPLKCIPRSKSGASKSLPRWAAHTRIGSLWEYPPPRGLHTQIVWASDPLKKQHAVLVTYCICRTEHLQWTMFLFVTQITKVRAVWHPLVYINNIFDPSRDVNMMPLIHTSCYVHGTSLPKYYVGDPRLVFLLVHIEHFYDHFISPY